MFKTPPDQEKDDTQGLLRVCQLVVGCAYLVVSVAPSV